MRERTLAPVTVTLTLIALALASATPMAAATWFVPGAAEIPGENGAYYSSTLWVTNAGSSPAAIECRYIPFAGMPAAAPVVQAIQAGETREFESVLTTLFGLSTGAGTIVLVADGAIVANLTTANTADLRGTFGLAIRPVPEAELAYAGETHEVVFASHKADLKSASRTNVSAVLVDPNTSFTVTVFDPDGAEVGKKTISSATPVHWQESLGRILGDKDLTIGRLAFQVTSGRVAVYDSVVDNLTNDGFAIQGVPSSRAKKHWLLAGMSRSPGEKGTFWTSDVWVYNPQSIAIQVTFTPWFVAPGPFMKSVGPKGVIRIVDIIGAGGFGLENASGVVEVRSDSTIFVESRTYNSDPANPAKGTYSATVPAFSDDLLVRGPGKAAVNVAEASDSFRTNLTLFTASGGEHELRLVDHQGTEISRTTARLSARTSWQQSLAGWFPDGAGSIGALSIPLGFKGTVFVEVPANVLFQGYVSRVDNGTGDGIAPALTAIQSCTPPEISSFSAVPSSATPGAVVTIALASSSCVSAKVSPGDLPIPCSGSITVQPTETTEYTATVIGACDPPATAKTSVNVGCPDLLVTLEPDGATNFCEGGSVQLVASAKDCPDCAFTFRKAGQVVQSGPSRIFVASSSGAYTVEARDAKNCLGTSGVVPVHVEAKPDAMISAPASVAGDATFTASVADGGDGALYDWNVTSGTVVSGAGTRAVRIAAPGSGVVEVSVHVMNVSGCDASSSRRVSVACDPPVVTISASGPTTFCGGEAVTLTALPAGLASYSWSTGATTQSIVVTTSGSYTVTGATGAGCLGTSAAQAITVKPTPILNPRFRPEGTTTLLWVSPGYSRYLWSTGETSDAIYVCRSDTYSVTVTNEDGCSASHSFGGHAYWIFIQEGLRTYWPGCSVVLRASSGLVRPWAEYLWSNGATTESIEVSIPGTYTVRGRSSACATFTEPSAPVTVSEATEPVISAFSASPATVPLEGTSTITFTVRDGGRWELTSSLGNSFLGSFGYSGGVIVSTYTRSTAPGPDTITLTVTGPCGEVTTESLVIN